MVWGGHEVKWLSHVSDVLTLTTCADYIPEVETENPLPEPVAAVPKTNVVNLHRSTAGWTRRLVADVRSVTLAPPLPSVTESDAEALVAQPVHITVERDIRSGPRDG